MCLFPAYAFSWNVVIIIIIIIIIVAVIVVVVVDVVVVVVMLFFFSITVRIVDGVQRIIPRLRFLQYCSF